MAYHLSPENEAHLLPTIQKLIKANGNITLRGDPVRTEYLLRSAANTKYPELKRYRFKVTDTGVECILKHPTIVDAVPESMAMVVSHTQSILAEQHHEQLDYFGVIQYINDVLPIAVTFTNAFLTEKELTKLSKFCASKGYTTTTTDGNLTITRNA